MYIATGDAYGYLNGANVFWGGTYSMGVMKSMDGGRTWNPTKLSWLLSASKQVFRLLIYPHDPNIIIAAATDGIWRSVDAGETWVNTKTGNFKDLEFNVKNPSIIYASGKPTGGSIILRSIDTGRTWLNTTISGNSNSIILATTEAVDSILYAAQLNGSGMNIYRSENSGKTWAMKGTTSTTTFYSFYTMAIGVSNKDPDMVFLGGVDLVKSTNKGASFTKVSNWYGFGSYDYSHADHRVIKFYPGSKDKFINGNDGGVFQSTDAGVSYTDLSSNICALQFYRTGNSLTDEKFFIAGAQDNGVNRSKDGNWSHTRIGDGMESVVDPNNNDNVLAAIQYGNINVSYDGGNYFEPQKLNPATGNWIAPIVLNPRNSSTVFYGANFLYRSSNFGETWTGISKWNGANISDIVIPASDTNTIYFSIANDNAPAIAKIFRSTDGGKVWDNISGNGLPNEVAFLMDIAVDKHDAKKLYACYSGFAEGKKVYKSVDGGNSWNNFSDSLPNFPVNCVTVENSEEDGVYVGTDIGVFYRNNKMTGWKYWNDGLPAVIINELEILPLAKKIRAATFGRGVWEAEISGTLTRVEKVINLEQNVKLYPNPSPGHINLDYSTQFIHIKSISVINTLGQIVKILPEGQINPGKIYLDGIKSGIYLLTIHTSQGLISKKIQINSPD